MMIYIMKQLWLISFLLQGTIPTEEKDTLFDLNTSMIVFSDPHYFDPSLSTEGSAITKE